MSDIDLQNWKERIKPYKCIHTFSSSDEEIVRYEFTEAELEAFISQLLEEKDKEWQKEIQEIEKSWTAEAKIAYEAGEQAGYEEANRRF